MQGCLNYSINGNERNTEIVVYLTCINSVWI